MRHPYRLVVLLLLFLVCFLVWNRVQEQDGTDSVEQGSNSAVYLSEHGMALHLYEPTVEEVISSPLTISGEAPGIWFFEATFPIMLVNWDGLIIASGFASAQEDWMTQEMVPFTGVLNFESQETSQDFFKNGALILQKDNPSGLPEFEDAVEIPVRFAK